MSWKTSPLVRSEILRLFGNILATDHICSGHRWEKLRQQVETVLSQKRNAFSLIFIAFSKSTQNFALFEKKDQLHSLNILQVIDPDKCGYFNFRKLVFQDTLH